MDPNTLADSLQQRIDRLKQEEQELQGLPSMQRITFQTRKDLEALVPGVTIGEPTAVRRAQELLGGESTPGELLLKSPSLKQRDLSSEETTRIEQILDRPGPFGG